MTAPADSRHFTLQRVADGVYAAIARDGAGAMSNVGIVDLGDRVLVFDTFMTPQAAEDLRAAAEALIGHPIAYVVNSHWHDDHVRGNQAFSGAEIVATDRTSLLMATKTSESAERYRERASAHFAGLRQQYASVSDERERARLAIEISHGDEILATLPALEIRLPTHTFAERLTFRGPAREVQLLSYGGGHTESDAFLYLPAERILFAADLVVHRTHPWMGDGNPDEWPRILDRLEALDIGMVVPGHGPLAGREAIGAVRAYLGDVQKLATALLRAGNSADDLAQAPMPDAYDAWDAPDVFAPNMQFLGEHLTAHVDVQSSPPSTPAP